MKIKVNYYYNQKYLPTKRHRNERERQIADTLEINLRELSADMFPIAFIVHDMKSVYQGAKSYDDFVDDKYDGYKTFPEEIRAYNGELYMPIRITHGAAISTEFEDEKFVIHNLERMFGKDWYCGNDEFTEKSIVIRDTKDYCKKDIRKAAKSYIYCDGKFWRPCNEPRYVINTFGLGHNHGGTGFFIEYHYNPNIPNTNYFNALQRDEAIAYGKAVAARRGDTESIDGMGEDDNIEVLMPEMVKVNPNKEHGSGDKFLNDMENIISNSDSVLQAGMLCLALTGMIK